MVVEKQSDTSNLSNFDAQSALVITTKDQVINNNKKNIISQIYF
jgi:hypothetical protein